jgi:hypothetical protein
VIVPGPLAVVVNVYCGVLNVAVTVVFAVIGNVQMAIGSPAHGAPVQPAKFEYWFGTGVRVITVYGGNDAPVGDCVMVPGPETLVGKNVADTAVFAVTIRVHAGYVLLFSQAPPQYAKVSPVFGVAANATVVLFASDVPVGDCETVPGPVTDKLNEYFMTVVTPVPVRFAEAIDPLGPLMFNVAARAPNACGVNVTVTEHEPPMGSGADVHGLDSEKSSGLDPPIVTALTTAAAVAVFGFWS